MQVRFCGRISKVSPPGRNTQPFHFHLLAHELKQLRGLNWL
jgi:hypothetical protein